MNHAAALAACSFPGYRFSLVENRYLQIEAEDTCASSGLPTVWRSRKWLLSPHMTTSELVQTAFKAVLTAVEHEARERFRYRGRTVFCPHFDVEALVTLCDAGAVDVRKEPP